ncbi:multicopper oxidase domain-containing protein [Lutibacter sp.]|uniref:multicopper oxidase domain-containing protein n=1 Tax=Lutibacter sp. TaxID=1925666 RepID=UPI0025B81E42|nr:multicopper oxidase domain-containing protein [Lutibacter sp.]MCF6182943.1 multicopper oxidase domain-containing protein [Lutibacter sp.]
MKKLIYMLSILFLFIGINSYAQTEKSVEGNVNNLPVKEYTLILKQEKVNKAGTKVVGMTINGTIPGPVLEFTEGEYAIIYVKNEMNVETSIHWHGLLLPNFYDGVPYLTTPPIEPGHTLKYEFPIKQSGTYWYHGHTLLQEQVGVFGAIVIHPKKETLKYDKELVLMLSDWTNEKPMNVLRNLKRGTEWYTNRKGTSTPLNQVIKRGALGAQLNFWKQRMEGVDIADIYYPAFLINGEQSIEYPEFKAGEKVRLRIIDGGASTSFWMTFGGGNPLLVSADGLDVVPIKKNKTFIAIAEAYDFIVTIPEDGKIEFKITAQDGSGTASVFLGKGKVLKAPNVMKPDKIGMMMNMAKMDMKMGAHGLKFRPKKDERFKMKKEYDMQMKGKMKGMDMNNSNKMNSSKSKNDKMKNDDNKVDSGKQIATQYNYDYLKSPKKTNFNKDIPVKEILLNLTGNMQRYIWSMNGVPLSEADKIKIKGNQVTRITLNNLTMMHHPMHLHGHFFRVINKNGDYSPLKHTVNVPPMQSVTIEFYGNEYGDWFFHCHILYHLMGGMARVISYDTPRDPRMKGYPVKTLLAETDRYYTWGLLDATSSMTAINLTTSNIRNQFNASVEYGWNKNMEAEFTYEYYLHDYLRVFGGVNIENEIPDSLNNFKTTAVAGIRFLTPYLFSLDTRIDSDLRTRVSLGKSILIFPKLSVFGYYEYQIDFGIVNNLPTNKNYLSETVWSAGAEYMFSRNFSLMASYDNRYGGGAGLSIRF